MSNDLISEYLATLVTRGTSLATQRASRSDLMQFCRWWETRHQQPFDVAHVVDRDLRDWKHQRQQVDGAAPATINRGLSTLRQFCTWAVEQKLVAENSTIGIEDIPSTPLAPRSLPDQAVDALLRAARNEHDLQLRLRDEAYHQPIGHLRLLALLGSGEEFFDFGSKLDLHLQQTLVTDGFTL